MDTIKKDLSSFGPNDWAILSMATAVFLPHTLFLIVLVCIEVYLLVKRNLKEYVRTQPCWKAIYGFIGLEAIVSAFYQNFWGLGITLGLFGVFVFIAFYQQNIHPKLFFYLVEWAIVLGVLLGMGALVQFAFISHANGYSFFSFHIFDSPKRRIFTTFQNANIYAMMIDMLLVCILYRFLQTKSIRRKIWYVFLALFQFGLVLLTGCRAALVPLVFVIPVMLGMAKEKKWLLLYFVCLAGLLFLIGTHPQIIPRFDDVSTIQSRFTIWKYAWQGIQRYPLFGNGPWTFHRLHPVFHGHIGSHAHNIYINCMLSYGIVGTAVLLIYIHYLGRQMYAVKKQDGLLFGLMISIVLIICIMGLVDGTVDPIKNKIFFLMILNTGSIYLNPDHLV